VESFWNHFNFGESSHVSQTQEKQASPIRLERMTSALGKDRAMQITNVFIGFLQSAGFQNAKKRNVFLEEIVAWNHFGIICFRRLTSFATATLTNAESVSPSLQTEIAACFSSSGILTGTILLIPWDRDFGIYSSSPDSTTYWARKSNASYAAWSSCLPRPPRLSPLQQPSVCSLLLHALIFLRVNGLLASTVISQLVKLFRMVTLVAVAVIMFLNP